jgi:hypothetical protein
MRVQIIGGCMAALSVGLLVGFLSTVRPGGEGPPASSSFAPHLQQRFYGIQLDRLILTAPEARSLKPEAF